MVKLLNVTFYIITNSKMKILDCFNAYNCSPEMAEWEPVSERTEKDWNTTSRIYKAYILSKDYWWIKRLVKNDKVDINKLKHEIYVNMMESLPFENYERLIMLLSIQDEPLKFLESILK